MRAVYLSRKALDVYDHLGLPEREALERIVFELMDESVPLVGAEDRAIRHGISMIGRGVPETDLVVCYIPAGPNVHVINVMRR